MSETILFFLSLFIFLLAGVPVSVSLGLCSAFLIYYFDLGVSCFAAVFFASAAKYQLLAIPFFILAGLILDKTGISERLLKLIGLIIGGIAGGLAYVAVLIGLVFAGVSGSGPADAAALATVLIPVMVSAGYDINFSSALIASCGSLAIVIPPSIAFIIYGGITGTSVSELFAAGIMPGIIISLSLIIPVFYISKKNNWAGGKRGSLREIIAAFKESVWGLAAPVIILGGIYTGIFTPTESAVIAVVYALFVGCVIYKTLNLKSIYNLFKEALISSAVVMLIISFAGLYSWAAATLGIIDKSSVLILESSSNQHMVLILINIILLISGMFLDAVSIYSIFLPILMPVISHFNWNPVWFGIIMTVNLAIGQITPPVAVNLFVVSNISNSSVENISKRLFPFIFAMIAALALLILFPEISLFIPELLNL